MTLARTGSLTPVLSDKYALGWQHLVICSFFCLLFLYLSYIPLFHTETWRHAGLGKWILEHHTLPVTDPSVPLAAGRPAITTSWLSQVTMAFVATTAGDEALAAALAVCQVLSLILLFITFLQQSQRRGVALTGVVVVTSLWWGQLGVLRPEVSGTVCLSLLLCILARIDGLTAEGDDGQPLPRFVWIALPALMALWASLNGSVLIGGAVLLFWAAGQVIDSVCATGSIIRTLNCRRNRSIVWLAEFSLAATLLNPVGIDLWTQAFRLHGNPFWAAAGGSRPLDLSRWAGLSFIAFWVAAIVLLRRSRRPLRASDVMILAAAPLLVVFNELMIWWFAPLAVFALVPQLTAVLLRRRSGSVATRVPVRQEPAQHTTEAGDRPFRFGCSLLCCLMVWLAFSLSPVATPILGGTPRQRERIHSQETPLTVSQYLREHPPQSLVWAPRDWADWLVWDGPQGLQVFANSAFDRLPRQVRYDYGRIWTGADAWERILDRYDVSVLIIDKRRQGRLRDAALRGSARWRVGLEDRTSLVLVRIPEQTPGVKSRA